jgi:hypothetical protein
LFLHRRERGIEGQKERSRGGWRSSNRTGAEKEGKAGKERKTHPEKTLIPRRSAKRLDPLDMRRSWLFLKDSSQIAREVVVWRKVLKRAEGSGVGASESGNEKVDR